MPAKLNEENVVEQTWEISRGPIKKCVNKTVDLNVLM